MLANTPVQHVITTQVGDMLPVPKRWLVNLVIKKVKKMVPAWRIDGTIGFRAALARGAAASFKPVQVSREDIAFLQYTGGTTGVSKGAMLTHRNILANLEQTGMWISVSFKEGTEIAIAPLPMYHIFCLTSTLSFMKWGSLIVLITNPRDMPAFVKELGRWKWSVMTGVNTLFNGLLNTPGFDKLDFSALKVVVGGGAAVQKAVAERWQQVTGQYITEAYGLTESSPGVCCVPLDSPWNGTIGLPLPSTEMSIRDDAFNELPVWTGEGDIEKHTGEICVRGPQVMKGYWNNPEETAKVMRDGWLKTGDIGHLDAEGYVTITDRKKDMILVSGFNVYPNEIESVVATHPGVLECGVVGVPDAKSGEAVKVVIVRKDPGLTKEAVIEHCRTHLTGYKLPRHVEFRDVLPKTPIGKVLRRELVDSPKAVAALPRRRFEAPESGARYCRRAAMPPRGSRPSGGEPAVVRAPRRLEHLARRQHGQRDQQAQPPVARGQRHRSERRGAARARRGRRPAARARRAIDAHSQPLSNGRTKADTSSERTHTASTS